MAEIAEEYVEQGKVLAVTTVPSGDELTTLETAGSTSIAVSNAADFSDAGGQLQIAGTIYSYITRVDGLTELDDDIITLDPSTPLIADADVDTKVFIWPLSYEKEAMVDLASEEENVLARVPHGLYDKLTDGIRDVTARESVTLQLQGNTWVLQDLVGLEPKIDGGYLDPATVPQPASDGLPPGKVSGVRTLGAVRGVYVQWAGLPNYDAVTYAVYGGFGTGFPLDAAHLIGKTDGTQFLVREVYSDTAATTLIVDPNTTYFFQVIAQDVDGSYTGVNDEVTGSPIKINSPDIAAAVVSGDNIIGNTVTADKLAATMIISSLFETAASGQRVEFDSNGLRLIGPSEEVLANLPTNTLSRLFFKGKMETDDLTILGNMLIQGLTNRVSQASKVTLAQSNQLQAGAAPTLTQAIPTLPITISGDPSICWDGTNIVSASGIPGDQTTGSIRVYDVTSGLLYSMNTNFNPLAITYRSADNKYYCYVQQKAFGVGQYSYGVVSFGIDKTNHVLTSLLTNYTSNSTSENYKPGGNELGPCIGGDGTGIYVASISASTLMVRSVTSASTLALGAATSYGAVPSGAGGVGSMQLGTFDVGATRWYFTFQYSGGNPVNPTVYAWNGTARAAANDWVFASGSNSSRITYRGTAGVVSWYGLSGNNVMALYPGSGPGTFSYGYSWTDASGGYESTCSAVAQIATVKGTVVKITLPSYPTPYGSAVDPDGANIYAAAGAVGSTSLKKFGAITGQIATVAALAGAGTTAPLTTSTFPVIPGGTLVSEKADGLGALINLDGSGPGRTGWARWNSDGTNPDDSGWVEIGSGGSAPAFTNSWVNYGGGYETAAYRKIVLGGLTLVILKGLIKNGTLGVGAFTLPVGCRPLLQNIYAGSDASTKAASAGTAHTHGDAHGRIDVQSNGTVVIAVGANGYASLSGIIIVAQQ